MGGPHIIVGATVMIALGALPEPEGTGLVSEPPIDSFTSAFAILYPATEIKACFFQFPYFDSRNAF
jgi:hypothetical protein